MTAVNSTKTKQCTERQTNGIPNHAYVCVGVDSKPLPTEKFKRGRKLGQ